jgi:tight adherence protein C
MMQYLQHLDRHVIFGICLFGAVALLAFVLIDALMNRRENPLQQRLQPQKPTDPQPTVATARAESTTGPISATVQMISRAASKPIMPKQREEQSKVRVRLAHAGIYSPSAVAVFVGCKLIGLFAGFIAGGLLGLAFSTQMGLLLACWLGLMGYMLPGFWLKWQMSRRQRVLQSSLPDALDLMVVCVEAGLTIDAAIQRVGQEIALAHPEISRELGITHMETRIGVSRIEALRNLGFRTGSTSLQSLAAMLVQAERFGTSIGQALRVHAESLRDKRRYAAEEQAAKTTVKLAFPVVLFIFPTVLVVLGGPAFILFYKSPLFQ